MDENKGPSSYDAPKPGEYGNPESSVTDIKDTVTKTASSTTSEVKDTVTDIASSAASEAKDTVTDIASSTASEVKDTFTDTASSAAETAASAANSSPSASDSSSTINSAFKLADSNPQPSTSHQEVFGGQVEGTANPQNNYYTNTATSYGAPEEISKGFGIASLVMGILCILTCCCWFLSIIFGVLGIIFFCVQPKDSNGSRPTQATIGLVLSIVGLVLSIGIIAVGVLSANSSWYQEFMNSANL